MTLTAEERLLFLSSSPGSSATGRDDMARRLSSIEKVDFARLLDLARRNGVLPFLWRSLEGLDAVPEGSRRVLRNAWLLTCGRNVSNAHETLRIIETLKSAGIDAIPLKGSLASDLVFGDPGLYLAADIDILVRPPDLEKAKALLGKGGYEYDEERERDLLSSHYHLILYRTGHHVELHWNLAKRYFDIPPEFWWEDSRMVEYNGKPLTMLSPERYLLYSIFRLFDHGFRPLKFLLLTAGLIERHGNEMDWAALLGYAERFGMRRLVIFVLRLVHDLFGTRLPDSVVRETISGYALLKGRIMRGMLGNSSRPHAAMLTYLSLMGSPKDAIAVAARRLFPGLSELRLRYNLAPRSKSVYLFYLLNPFLLLKRKTVR